MYSRFITLAIFIFVSFYSNAQTIDSLSSYHVYSGDTLTIYGKNFNSNKSQLMVKFEYVNSFIISADSSKVKIKVPNLTSSSYLFYIDTVNKKTACSNYQINVLPKNIKYLNIDSVSFKLDNYKLQTSALYSNIFQILHYPIDYNNDGIKDIYSISDSTKREIYFLDSTKVWKKKKGNSAYTNGQSFHDLNSDGKLDQNALSQINNNSFGITELNTSTKDSIKSYSKLYSYYYTNPIYPFYQIAPFFYADFDGDHRLDLIKISSENLDTFILLNKLDTNNRIKLNLSKIKLNGYVENISAGQYYAYQTININNDEKTDLAISLYTNNAYKRYLFINKSIGDSLVFEKVDSIISKSLRYICLDIDNDQNDEMIEISDSFKIFKNTSKIGCKFKKLIYKKQFNGISFVFAKFVDLNNDKVIDIICKNFDTTQVHFLSIKNDTIFYNTKHLFYNDIILGIDDVNNDGFIDILSREIINGANYIKFRYGRPIDAKLNYSKLNFLCDSVNQIMSDSVEINISPSIICHLDSIKKNKFELFTDRNYSKKLKQIPISKDTTLKLYFRYKYTTNSLDTLNFNYNSSSFAQIFISAILSPPTPELISVDKNYAIPGDTINLIGKNLFKNINDISLRLNNRQCAILNNSTKNLIKFIYPKYTNISKLVLTDTSKKMIAISNFDISPIYKSDTIYNLSDSLFKTCSFFTNNDILQIYTNTQKTDEIPVGLNGHYFKPFSCPPITSTTGFKFGAAYKPSQILRNFASQVDVIDFYNKVGNTGSNFRNQQLIDIDFNNKLDFINATEISRFCIKKTKDTLQYLYKSIPYESNPNNIDTTNDVFLFASDLDLDGKIEFLIRKNNSSASFFAFNYNPLTRKYKYRETVTIPSQYQNSNYYYDDINNDNRTDLVILYYDKNRYKLGCIFNKSTRGNIRFNDKASILIDSFYHDNYNILDLDADNINEIVCAKTVNRSDLKLNTIYKLKNNSYSYFDTFSCVGYISEFLDINNDKRKDIITSFYSYSYKLDSNSFKLKKFNFQNYHNVNSEFVDVNGDNKLDKINDDGNIYFQNKIDVSYSKKEMNFTNNAYNTVSFDSFWVKNKSFFKTKIVNFYFSDTSAYFLGKLNSNTKKYYEYIKPNDSILIHVGFKGKVKYKKYYFGELYLQFDNISDYNVLALRTYIVSPVKISDIIPKDYFPGDTIAIIGRNFDNYKSKPELRFENTIAKIVSFNDTIIYGIVPNGNIGGRISVVDTNLNEIAYCPYPINYTFNGTSALIKKTDFSLSRIIYTNNKRNYNVLDINRDGKPDIVYDTMGFSPYKSYLNNSKDSVFYIKKSGLELNPFIPYDYYGYFDRDTLIDYIDVSSFGNKVTYMKVGNNGYPILNNVSYFGPMTTLDINSNGKIDFVVAGSNSKMSITENIPNSIDFIDSNCYFYEIRNKLTTKSVTRSFSSSPIYMFDFDGDGKSEIIYDSSNFVICYNNSIDTLIKISTGITLTKGKNISYKVRDLNNDSKLDIITACYNNQNGIATIETFRNTSSKGNLSFTKKIDTLSNMAAIDKYLIEDINGDKKPDLIVLANTNNSDSFFVYTNTSSSSNIQFSTRCALKIYGDIKNIYSCDLNLDGKTDLIVSNDTSLFLFKNKSISGRLSKYNYNFSHSYGQPFSISMAIYNQGSDTLRIPKITFPNGYKLYNSSGLFNLNGNSLGNNTKTEVSLPLSIPILDSFNFVIERDSAFKNGTIKDSILFFNNQYKDPYKLKIRGTMSKGPLVKIQMDDFNFGIKKPNRILTDSFCLKNIGTDTLRISKIYLNDTINFKLTVPPNLTKIKINDSVLFKIRYVGLQKRYHSSYIKIEHNDYNKSHTIDLTGETIQGEISTVYSKNSGKSHINLTKLDTFYIVNTGNDTLFINNLPSSLKPFEISSNLNSNKYLLIKDTLGIYLKFKPDSIKNYVKYFNFSHSGVTGNTRVNLTGTGLAGNLSKKLDSLNLGVLKSFSTYKFEYDYINTGNTKLKIDSIISKNKTIVGYNCKSLNDSIRVNNYGYVCITVIPDSLYTMRDTLKVYNDGFQGVTVILLKAKVLKASPKFIDSKIKLTSDYKTSITKKFFIKNFGTDTLANFSLSVNNSLFTITDSINFNKRILPGKSQGFNLKFNPNDSGTYNAIITLKTKNLSDISIPVEGLCVFSKINTKDTFKIESRRLYKNENQFYIKNLGNDTIKITKIIQDTSYFNINLKDLIVKPYDSIIANLSFKSDIFQKHYYNKISIIYNGYKRKDTLIANIYGLNRYPEIKLSKNIIDIGKVQKFDSIFYNYQIKNIGDDTFKFNTNQLSKFELLLPNLKYIKSNDSLDLKIKFNPLNYIIYTDTLKLTGNHFNQQSIIPIKGIGILNRSLINVSYTNDTVDFKSIKKKNSKKLDLNIKNLGTDTLNFSLNFPDSIFSINFDRFILNPIEDTTLSITFSPLRVQSYFGEILVNVQDQDSIKLIHLLGKATINPDYAKIEIINRKLNFGIIERFSESFDTCLIQNKGEEDITLETGFYEAPFNIKENSIFIERDSTRSFIYRFSPVTIEKFNSIAYFKLEDNLKFDSVELVGEATAKTNLNIITNSKFKLYPNPIEKDLTFESNIASVSNFELCVLDNLGRVISVNNDYRKIIKIDLSNYATGVYFVRILMNGEYYSYKINKI